MDGLLIDDCFFFSTSCVCGWAIQFYIVEGQEKYTRCALNTPDGHGNQMPHGNPMAFLNGHWKATAEWVKANGRAWHTTPGWRNDFGDAY